MRILAALLAALTLAAAAAAADGLVTRHSKEAGFAVAVPAAWIYRNATYPSDHSTELWIDPRDKASRLKVEVSACVGCVQPRDCIIGGTGCRPAPEAVLPAKVISQRKLDRWRVTYVARDPSSRYLVRALVTVLHDGSSITGFALTRVWLPRAKAALAGRILSSFRI